MKLTKYDQDRRVLIDFIDSLNQLRRSDDRGALAMLRRGLKHQPGTEWGSYEYVMPYAHGFPLDQHEFFFVVAALYGLYPSKNWRAELGSKASTNFGASFAQLQRASPSGKSVAKRFVNLLRAKWDTLPVHLRHAVRLMKTKGIPIDWVDLLYSLIFWDNRHRSVQRDWSTAFWSPASENKQDS